MNPALPLEHFVPDPEARVWSDGRLYVYGSYDISANSFYCSREYRVFSSADLLTWEDHGRSFATHDTAWGDDWDNRTLFAPDCVYHDGAYHLFFCTSADGEGVARSPSPVGPFTDPVPVVGAHGDAIDPAVFVDDDRQAYLYWGQFHARGARLRPDLAAIEPGTLKTHLITEAEHGFHEGASVRKRNGVYYLVYSDISRGRPTALGYATSDGPLGPFVRRGIIVDNAGCDPETWNNHGSIEEWNGGWYVFYHRSSQASRYNRRLCIEPITFNQDGTIDEVVMTTSGVSGPLPARRLMDASRACQLRGVVRAEPGVNDGEVLARIVDGDAACYRYFDFSGERTFSVTAASASYGGFVDLHLDEADGELVGSCEVGRTGSWNRFVHFSCDLRPVEGVHALWLRFRGGRPHDGERLFDLRSFVFGS